MFMFPCQDRGANSGLKSYSGVFSHIDWSTGFAYHPFLHESPYSVERDRGLCQLSRYSPADQLAKYYHMLYVNDIPFSLLQTQKKGTVFLLHTDTPCDFLMPSAATPIKALYLLSFFFSLIMEQELIELLLASKKALLTGQSICAQANNYLQTSEHHVEIMAKIHPKLAFVDNHILVQLTMLERMKEYLNVKSESCKQRIKVRHLTFPSLLQKKKKKRTKS
jgi:hypothetical protein